MTRLIKLTSGLLGATALVALSAPAYAVGTAAATSVDNTFVLTYDTGTATNTITNDGVGGNDDPTNFVVDRVVNLTVVGSASDDNAPGDTDVPVLFTVTNLGNDTQSYTLDTELGDLTPFALTDSTPTIEYLVIASGTCAATKPATGLTTYNPATPATTVPSVPADQILCVYVNQDIDVAATDGQIANIDLIATTTTDGTTTALTYNETNTIAGVQNIAIEGAPGNHSADGTDDGADSATSTYEVGAADVTATKTVALVSTDGTNCTGFGTAASATQGSEYYVPGACVEYTISATNAGSGDASDIDISDTLPFEVDYQSAIVDATGWSTAPTLAAASTGTCTSGVGTCDIVAADNGVLPGVTAPATVTGTVRIRALIK